MTWRFRRDTFQNIIELVASPDCSLEQLAKCPNVRAAFKRQLKNLIDYLVPNIQEIIDIVLGDKKESELVSSMCMYFMTNQSPSFTAQFSNNPLFLMRLSNCLTKENNANSKSLISFSRILEFLVKVSNGFVLKMYPDKFNLLPRLLTHINDFSVYSLLCEITDHGHKVTLEYLESINASKMIFESLGENTFLNGRILTLLTNIISSGIPGSPLVTYLVDEEHLNKIFELALSENQQVSSQSFKLLLEIYGLCDEELDDEDDDETDAYRISTFIMSKIPDMCDFIGSNKPYCAGKTVCNELLVSAIATCEKIPSKVYSLLKSLFPKMFGQPTTSSLHCLFLKLFNAVADRDEDFLSKFDVRHQIVSQFQKKDLTLAAYWGHLYSITSRILESKVHYPNECPGWNDFLINTYLKMKKIMIKQYGGPLPRDNDDSDMYSSDIEFKPPSKFYLMSERKNIKFITQDEIDADFDDRLALLARQP
ncbi:hypothetical protein M9Y10_013969 [Tritrichomonas musculus]|uniref:Uncharacterized protein n=1 Tax=Tritrichomonas musculus TaxID=1915356 RepID=A0ABR2KYA4_9EUKA